MEVEVTQVQNIFHPQGYVDFGMGGSMDDPKEVNLCLYNPSKRAVRVHSVSTLSKSIKIHYYNVRINPASDDANKPNMCVNVGTLTLDCKFLNFIFISFINWMIWFTPFTDKQSVLVNLN